MDELAAFVENDSFARNLGIEMLDYGVGYAKARLTIRSNHLNSAGILHGGAIFSLADAAFAVASNSHGPLAVAVTASISFFRALSEGTLIAEAREVALNRRLATYLIEVSDEAGAPVAQMQGTVYRKVAAAGGPSSES
jgi:acyl-CoA thioesterase